MVALRIVLIVCCILLCLLNSVQGAALQTIVGTINRVSDGDSVTALSNNNAKLRIRLLGIDAPEVAHDKKPGQPYGNEARDYRGHLIGGKPVRVDAYGRDQYHRVLAIIWDDVVNVNLLMIAMDYAEVYRGAPCLAYCRVMAQAEAKARQDRVGMLVQDTRYEKDRRDLTR